MNWKQRRLWAVVAESMEEVAGLLQSHLAGDEPPDVCIPHPRIGRRALLIKWY